MFNKIKAFRLSLIALLAGYGVLNSGIAQAACNCNSSKQCVCMNITNHTSSPFCLSTANNGYYGFLVRYGNTPVDAGPRPPAVIYPGNSGSSSFQYSVQSGNILYATVAYVGKMPKGGSCEELHPMCNLIVAYGKDASGAPYCSFINTSSDNTCSIEPYGKSDPANNICNADITFTNTSGVSKNSIHNK